MRRGAIIAGGMLLGMLATAGHQAIAQPVGEIEVARGVVLLHSPGQMPRTAARGVTLQQGDRLSSAEGGIAVVKLQDGTRMTVRPNTEMELARYQFQQGSPDNAMVLRLLRGGLRTVTGLISKGLPDAARIQTNTATIGIRGTDFDARLCTTECAAESAQVQQSAPATTITASAKVVSVQGSAELTDGGASLARRLIAGSSVYPGDTLETGDAVVTLAFRDDSRMTLGANTRMRVDNFVFDPENAREGRFLATLAGGSLRVLSGRIARAEGRNAVVSTATGSVELRQAGVDIRCSGDCASQTQGAGLEVFAWSDTAGVVPAAPAPAPAQMQVIQQGQGIAISGGQVRPLATLDAQGPRPDSIAPAPQLFARENVPESAEGLFVQVRDGHIEIASAGQSLHLGRGETGFAGGAGQLARPLVVPKFIEFDRVPLPVSNRPVLVSSLVMQETRDSAMCR
ncbi:FecR domain-containing protein [Ramlibacter sp.]|uniref:FecR domain-containing protein n=1 Tax=Ramlibacter sp. TaxID=1917967 RepID=UPI003D13491B